MQFDRALSLRQAAAQVIRHSRKTSMHVKVSRLFTNRRSTAESIGVRQNWAETRCLPQGIDCIVADVVAEGTVGDQVRRRYVCQIGSITDKQWRYIRRLLIHRA